MKHFFSFIILLFFLFGSGIQFATAAIFEVSSVARKPALYQQFQVDLMLNAENQGINAVEARVVFPENLLALEEIRDGGSIVTFWVDKPTEGGAVEEGLRQVYFSGVIPGGFEGVLSPYYEGTKPGRILSLIFVAKEVGEGVITVKDQKVYLHDGLGTQTSASILPLSFKVGTEIVVAPVHIPKDEDAPEPFTPEIVQDVDIFEGKYFLVFVAQDKGSGVDYYEIAEKRGKEVKAYEKLSWNEVQSPYILQDQQLKSTIYVKAVDRTGNERIALVSPENELSLYEKYFVWFIILVGILGLILMSILWRKRTLL
ncbi:MAG TPA: hypothetical protein ENI13_00715 [candidate division CPR3 bacterium]|uniref:Cohesin domain-containing protein n=1 Tax=candidate division CPR3 bacterium TaxID=2268181 RepID=A0A7C1NXN8_UNCC3|nr:hypothetical protein [candidate division CPR3 bacterium]